MFERLGLMAAVCLCATSLTAQVPSPPTPQTSPGARAPRPTDERTTTRDRATPMLTVEGCLGRDGVLSNAIITKGLPEVQGASGTTGTRGTGTAGTAGAEGATGATATGSRPTSGKPGTPERGSAGTLSAGSPRVGEQNPGGSAGLGTDPAAVHEAARTAQAAAQAAVHTFKLDGLAKEQLEPHVGRRVRVTGTVEDMASLSGGPRSAAGSTGDASGGTGASSAGSGTVGSGRTGASGTGTAAGTGTKQGGTPRAAATVVELEATAIVPTGAACQAPR